MYNQRKNLQDPVDELHHANLLLRRRTIQIETSVKVGQQMTSILDLKELLPQILKVIQAQFNYTVVNIWLINDPRDTITLEASTLDQKSGEAVVIPMNHKGLVAQSCRSGTMSLDNGASKSAMYTSTYGLHVVGSEITLPLKVQNETLGILDIQSERPQAFVPEDIAALEILTSQIVIAIRNARLYSKPR